MCVCGAVHGQASRRLCLACPPCAPPPGLMQAAAVSGVLQRTMGWGVQVVTDLGSDDEDEDGPVVVEGVELPV